jgi:predicted phage gp36 major capsid-like protein
MRRFIIDANHPAVGGREERAFFPLENTFRIAEEIHDEQKKKKQESSEEMNLVEKGDSHGDRDGDDERKSLGHDHAFMPHIAPLRGPPSSGEAGKYQPLAGRFVRSWIRLPPPSRKRSNLTAANLA